MYCTARKNIDSWPPTTRPIVGQAADPAPAAQQRGTQQRVGHPALGDGQQGDQGGAGDEAEDGAGRGPAVLGDADEGPDERDRATGGAERADDVEPAGPARGLVDVPPRQREDRQPDRHVDEQRPAPRAEVGDRATEQQAQRHAAGGDGTEQGERAQPGGLVGRARGEQREYAGRGHRRADTLQGAGGRRATRASAPVRRGGRRAVKTATPPRNSRRRPNTSPSRPPSSSRPPKARVKALSTQESEAGPKPRSASILGSATFTTVASRMNISCAIRTMAMPIAARPALSGSVSGRPGGSSPGRVRRVWRSCGEVLFWPGGPRYS